MAVMHIMTRTVPGTKLLPFSAQSDEKQAQIEGLISLRLERLH